MCDCVFPEEILEADSKSYGNKRMYFNWYNMIRRCYKPDYKDFKDYGARGIRICEQWLTSLKCYIEDVGETPSGMTFDRMDNDLGYCPCNFRWADKRTQSLNRRQFKRPNNLPKGVYIDRKTFRAQIKLENKLVYLGNFDNPDDAKKAFDEAFFKEHGRYP